MSDLASYEVLAAVLVLLVEGCESTVCTDGVPAVCTVAVYSGGCAASLLELDEFTLVLAARSVRRLGPLASASRGDECSTAVEAVEVLVAVV